jgi:predicted GIY-YIG superfamily endonuclease
MGLRNGEKWTKEEDGFLEENYKTKGAWYCVENLERNFNSVTKRYGKLFIKKEPKIIEIDKEVWSYEKCKEEALKYKSKASFIRVNNEIYKYIIHNNWDELLLHIKLIEIKPSGYWTYERCKEEALKYNTMVELAENCVSAYNKIQKNRWKNELCSHIEYGANLFKRMVYVYIFSDNHCYIGLTCNKEDRKNRHKKDGPVYDYIVKTGLNPEYIELTDYIDVIEASELEKFYIKEYEKNGFMLLNTSTGGQLGSSIVKWTYDKLKEEVTKYKTISDFAKKCSGGLKSAVKNRWMDEFFPNNNYNKPKIIWDYNKCKEESIKYKSRTEFDKNCYSAYKLAKINGWLDEWFPPLNRFLCEKRRWNEESVRFEASKCKGKSQFRRSAPRAYDIALRDGYLNELFPEIEWTYETCKLEAMNYKDKADFSRKFPSAYRYAKENNLLDEFYPSNNKNNPIN